MPVIRNLFKLLLAASVALAMGACGSGGQSSSTARANHAPVANNDAYSLNEDTTLSANVTSNDTDADGDPVTAVLDANPARGTVAFNASGSFIYTPNLNYSGSDVFTYHLSDGKRVSGQATVNLTIVSVNDAPVAHAATLKVVRGETQHLQLHASDAENDPLTFAISAAASHGAATIDAASGVATYTPDTGYTGSDSFAYVASDGRVNSTPAAVSVTVVPPPQECDPSDVPQATVTGEFNFGQAGSSHSFTRGHNRKVLYDPSGGRWYVFYLYRDGNDAAYDPAKEGVVARMSADGITWSAPKVVEPGQIGGITAVDVVRFGERIYFLSLTGFESDADTAYGVREILIDASTGELTVGPSQVVHANTAASINHFYGSLLHDSEGYFWVAARVCDSCPGTHAEIIRSTNKDDITAWGPGGCLGSACNDAWANPFPEMTLEVGTIANRLLDLGPYGVGVVTYNKKNNESAPTVGQILFRLNPTRGHNGWSAPASPLVLTRNANQYDGINSVDSTRSDDRRFSAIVDPTDNYKIHVVYVTRDTANAATNARLKYFTLSPPYTAADKSAEQTLVDGEVDGTHLSVDTRTSPSTIHAFYIENQWPELNLRMLRTICGVWQSAADALAVTGYQGTSGARYPQPPEQITTDELVVGHQSIFPVNSPSEWDIVVSRIVLTPPGSSSNAGFCDSVVGDPGVGIRGLKRLPGSSR